MLVKFKGVGKNINKRWHFDGDKFEVTQEDYEKYKDNLEIITDESENKKARTLIIKIENEAIDLDEIKSKIDELIKSYEEVVDSSKTNDDDDAEAELQELRTKAKELGIKNAHLMGKEKLEKAIAEKTAPLFGSKNTDETENTEEGSTDETNDDDYDTTEPEEDTGATENPQE